MTGTQPLTITQLAGLFNTKSLYFLSYSWLFGQSIWVTFLGGAIAYKTLPRQHFSLLQTKTFPIYFATSLSNASLLLALWISNNPQAPHHLLEPLLPAVAQTWVLGLIVLMTSANWLWIGPATGKLIVERQKQERAEGKPSHDPHVSQQMKAMNKRFGILHGLSSLFNLLVVIALIFHGLWITNGGLKQDW